MADAEKILRHLLDVILDEKGYQPRELTIEAIPITGGNYTSVLFNVSVSSPGRDDLSLFAKVACVVEVMRPLMHADWLYDTERTVYCKLAKIYEHIQDENEVPVENRFVFPKFYGCNSEVGKETVVMENLIQSGYHSFDRLKSMDWAHASAAVENLARFHALSFAFEKFKPEEFKNFTTGRENLLFVQPPEDSNYDVDGMWTNVIEKALAAVKVEQRDAVKAHIMKHQQMLKLNKPLGKAVIAHGDYRMSNLLFNVQNDTLRSIAVDYQTVHTGCPANDLLYFIFLGSDEEFRRQHYAELLDNYHSSLTRALEQFSVDPDVYSRRTFDSDVKELLPYVVMLGMLVLPAVTLDAPPPGSAPQMSSEEGALGFLTNISDLYAHRFSGIVNDCIQWGVL